MADSDTATGNDKVPGLRWRIPAVLLVSVLVAYFDRMNISYAIPKIAADYGWTVKEIGSYGGLLMSIFFVGYGLSNMFLSPIGEKFGPRKSLLVIVILFSLLTAVAYPLGLMFSALIALRVCLGIAEGIHFPMNNKLTSQWFPVHERSRANAFWLAGLFLSMVLAPFVVVPIIEVLGWRAMFIVLGLGGMLITLPLLYYFIHNSPSDHPKITPAELSYIREGQKDEEKGEENFWKGIKTFLKRKTYWVAILGGIMNNMVGFGLLSWMPTYFTEGRGLKFFSLTYATSIPYAFAVFGIMLWSYLGDKTNKRAYIASIGFFCAGIVAWFAATAPTIAMVIALFSLTIFITVAYASNEYAIIQRILPRSHVASGVGFYNGFTMMIGGGLGPVIVGGVVSATGSYTAGLLSLAGLCMVGSIVMYVLGRMIKY